MCFLRPCKITFSVLLLALPIKHEYLFFSLVNVYLASQNSNGDRKIVSDKTIQLYTDILSKKKMASCLALDIGKPEEAGGWKRACTLASPARAVPATATALTTLLETSPSCLHGFQISDPGYDPSNSLASCRPALELSESV